MKRSALALLLAGSLTAIAPPVLSAEYRVTIVNLTRGIYFTPLLLTAHNQPTSLFTPGEPATGNLQAMAEGGDLSDLVASLNSEGADLVENPAGGLLAPGDSTTTNISTEGNPGHTRFSMVAMMLPTNDGFVGINSVALPDSVGEQLVLEVPAYDAGTEANNEIRGGGTLGVPGFPVPTPIDSLPGVNGTGITATAEGHVHIHRGALGDTDPSGGLSDIDAAVSRWLNPVARVTIQMISE